MTAVSDDEEVSPSDVQRACVSTKADNKQLMLEVAPAFPSSLRFFWSLHCQYLENLGRDEHSLEAFLSEHLKMGGVYWGTTSLWILGHVDGARTTCPSQHLNDECHSIASLTNHVAPCLRGTEDDRSSCLRKDEEICGWIMSCLRPCGGFGQGPGQDAHIVSTHYALLLLAGLDRLKEIDGKLVAKWIKSLQSSTGEFKGDEWGEADSRFVYSGVACLTLLDALDRNTADRAIHFISALLNFDGGFGWIPGGETHAASVFCCLAALALCEGLWIVDREQLAMWLIERQTEGGGFNGRPEKAPDVCYSFWITASLHILGYQDWMDSEKLTEFILSAQDGEVGGIADRPEDVSDVFHTYFGIAALSLMRTIPGLEDVHPVLSLPQKVVRRMKLFVRTV